MIKTKHWLNLVVVLLVAGLTAGGLLWLGPDVKPTTISNHQQATKQSLHLVGLGDSLTHGVGDDTNSGGYVALTAADLRGTGIATVTTDNFGKTGDTASQVQKRLDSQPKIQAGLKQADIITITVGGNDLMHVLQKNLFELKESQVTKGITQFQKRLRHLLESVQALNADAPIYLFGIYNPFYVYFPELTAMSASVQQWNQATSKTVSEFARVHYVDIDSVLTKGNGRKQPTQAAKQQLKDNPLIFSEDHFHPNNAGYQAMTAQLWDVMQATKKEWR